jgi:hypothetical protein
MKMMKFYFCKNFALSILMKSLIKNTLDAIFFKNKLDKNTDTTKYNTQLSNKLSFSN